MSTQDGDSQNRPDFLDNPDPREALHGALEWWIQKHDKGDTPEGSFPPVLTKSVLILEVQEPLRKNKTLCFRTTNLSGQGLHSWEILGLIESARESTRQYHNETTVDPEDAPPNDFEADDGP